MQEVMLSAFSRSRMVLAYPYMSEAENSFNVTSFVDEPTSWNDY